ncbi:MAG TPA: DegT/DnrJ/EryC1/StrS family aminotransferase [Acidobacteriaceae bacterium]|jgi:dTDP-4-amino-4,6-dideoxygalactose transaminase
MAGAKQKSPARIPFIRPEPPKLSCHTDELAQIENSGIYSNYGPVNTQLELEFISSMFGQGDCLTVCNATIGLMMSIRTVIGDEPPTARRYALMPSFTFAAAAHAAMWCGLTPLLCDVAPDTWLPDAESEEALLLKYAGQVSVILPCATFGNNLDLAHYRDLSRRYGVPIVVDAAASLGSQDHDRNAFGAGFEWPVIFSMHATKLFATGEGGLIYCADKERVARLRTMGSFGFEQPRSATMFGINSKMAETSALSALLQLRGFADVVQRRDQLVHHYAQCLSKEITLQRSLGRRQAHSFVSILLPKDVAYKRDQIRGYLRSQNIETASYFSPHLVEQPFFQKHAVTAALPNTEEIATRIVSLPTYEGMSVRDVKRVVSELHYGIQTARS